VSDTGAQVLGTGKPLALLTYLTLAPGRTAGREFLADLLWADLEADHARHALRQSLWQLRHGLGEAAFSGRDELRLDLALPSDRDEFLAAMERGDYDQAVERYTGPFLPAFAAPGGVEFEQWADLERDRLRAIFLRASEMATRRKLAVSQFRDAQRIARRARDEAPDNELGWRLLLEALIGGRDFITAALEADVLEGMAAAEHRELEPATRATIRLARQMPTVGPRPEPELVAELVGREQQFSTIIAARERAASGPSTHVHVSAPAGLGKTRLLHDVQGRLAAAGQRAIAIRAHPGERQIPYALVSELARAATSLPGVMGVSTASAGALVALNPALSSRISAPPDLTAGDDALRNRTIALTEALTAAAEEGPFSLFIDDLHWADTASRQVLDGILSRLDGARVAVVTAARPSREPVPSTDATVTLSLPPLTEAQVESFVTSLGSVPADQSWGTGLVRGLHLAASGSPLLLLQLLKLAIERGALSLDDLGWHCPDEEPLGRMLREGEAMRSRLDALSREERWLITTLAVAGIPLSHGALSQSAGRDPKVVANDLESLERLGLVRRGDESWELAHDEIGVAACAGLSEAAEHSVHRSIGTALTASAGDDPALLIRAARHQVVADDVPGLRQLFRRYIHVARRRGDDRSPAGLLTDVLGGAGTPQMRTTLLGSLPISWRIGLWSTPRLVLAGLAAGLVVVGVITRAFAPAPAGPAAELVIFSRGDSVPSAYHVDVDLAGWNAQSLLPAEPEPTTGDWLPGEAIQQRFSPDGTRLLFTTRTGEKTTDDLMLLEHGRIRRLTAEPRDDSFGMWSPDGRWVAFLTARWSPQGADDNDVAILDPATGAVRQLTRTRDWDLGFAWSPDGSRLAVARRSRANLPGRVCVVTFDGLEETCHQVPGYEVSSVLGWADHATVVIGAETVSDRAVLAYKLDTRSVDVLKTGDFDAAGLSPDGAWLSCYCSRTPSEPFATWVMPVRAPTQMRRVALDLKSPSLAWRMAVPPPVLDTLRLPIEITVAMDGVESSEVIAVDARGNQLPLPRSVYRWSVGDTTLAVIDPHTGQITPKRTGTTQVTVTAGGWRETTALLRVIPPRARTVLVDSTWMDLDPSPTSMGRWRLFGDPPPRRVDSIGGPAVSNNGDGVYSSGIYSRETFSAQDGIGVEVVLSVPVTAAQWQKETVELVSRRGAGFDGWDHRSGGPPATAWAPEVCFASYPGGEGSFSPERVAVAAGGVRMYIPTDQPYQDGRWFRIRVQVFGDGTCGFAINGRPVWRSAGRVPLDQPYRALLSGNSAGTTIRIRKVEMWQGVKPDVAWGGLDGSGR